MDLSNIYRKFVFVSQLQSANEDVILVSLLHFLKCDCYVATRWLISSFLKLWSSNDYLNRAHVCWQALDSVDHALIIDCSQWLLKNHPEEALNLFVTLDPPLPPSLVLSQLKSSAPTLQVSYLEQVMERRPETRSLDLENELVWRKVLTCACCIISLTC